MAEAPQVREVTFEPSRYVLSGQGADGREGSGAESHPRKCENTLGVFLEVAQDAARGTGMSHWSSLKADCLRNRITCTSLSSFHLGYQVALMLPPFLFSSGSAPQTQTAGSRHHRSSCQLLPCLAFLKKGTRQSRFLHPKKLFQMLLVCFTFCQASVYLLFWQTPACSFPCAGSGEGKGCTMTLQSVHALAGLKSAQTKWQHDIKHSNSGRQ